MEDKAKVEVVLENKDIPYELGQKTLKWKGDS